MGRDGVGFARAEHFISTYHLPGCDSAFPYVCMFGVVVVFFHSNVAIFLESKII